MDGVPLISFPPIAPGEVFTYEFPLRQSGTYWYHSHSGLQEQRDMYGAIVILPEERTKNVEMPPITNNDKKENRFMPDALTPEIYSYIFLPE